MPEESQQISYLKSQLADAERQLRIEESLDRVRAKALAMQTSDDILSVAVALKDEVVGLGFDGVLAGSVYIHQPDGTTRIYDLTEFDHAGEESPIVNDIIIDPAVDPPDLPLFKVVNLKEDYQVVEFDVEELWRLETWYRGHDLDGSDQFLNLLESGFDRAWVPAVRLERGVLALDFLVKPPEEIETVLRQMASAFNLAYQRFEDLTQAEKDYQALLAEKSRTEEALANLQSTQAQLIQSEKLASLGALTAGIAHEIKNPLNFVNNFAEVSAELMDELGEAVAEGNNEEVATILVDLRANATQIAKHGKRADSIVKSMMMHARGGSSEFETIHLNTYLEEYANLAWHGMRARDHGFQTDLIREFDSSIGEISVMPQEFGRVILNLLNNAFDAVKNESSPAVTITTSKSNDTIEISVSDNGPGIPEDIREKIFEPFFTTKATGEGTGLGLSLSHDIITKGHGGELVLGTSSKGGASFIIRLPVS